MNLTRSLLLLYSAILIFFVPTASFAATLYIDPAEANLSPGDSKLFSVRLDVDGNECINIVDGVIYVAPPLVPVDISRGNSIFPLWVEEPSIDTGTGLITFAGGIPNGYCGRTPGDSRLTNVLFDIVVQVNSDIATGENGRADASIIFGPATRAYLNDGTGSPAPLRLLGSSVLVLSEPQSAVTDEWGERIAADTLPPNKFSIELVRDPRVFGGKYFITFNTTDKQTGIDRYEVKEVPLGRFNFFGLGRMNVPWRPAVSPYLLQDQSLNSTILVKAIDKAGNEYIATLVPDESLRSTKLTMIDLLFAASILIFAILIIVVALGFYRRRLLAKKAQAKNSSWHRGNSLTF